MKQTKQNKQTNIQGWRRLQQMEKFKTFGPLSFRVPRTVT